MSMTSPLPACETEARPAAEIRWPKKHDLFGVGVAASNYDEIADVVARSALACVPAVISLHAVHAIVESITDPRLLKKVNRFDSVLPDGQPVRWALNNLYGVGLKERVYGPELMLRLCARAALDGIPIYLYGSTQEVIDLLQERLPARFPGLEIAGAESPPFRQLAAEEDAEVVRRINDSGAGILFIGLGCPKQDHFAADHADRIGAVQICVGAAFEFHAGTKSMAPAWMQRSGLEWVYRLTREPRRLWKRYLYTNSVFVTQWIKATVRRKRA
jgi:N-acetylglucosaminyldiphosphoundecaprenol N-acetyl-beta-D-mannosaminyltransferase